MNFEINKHLFAAYCGLIKSGYELMDLSDPLVASVCEGIRNLPLSEGVISYFGAARTGQIPVNPYYPRGSDLGVACFFSERRAYLRFLRSCGSPDVEDTDFLCWIAHLTEMLHEVECCRGFSELFARYEQEVRARFCGVSTEIAVLQNRLKRLGPTVQILFAPNLLQSKYLADYALVDGKLYLIAAAFSRAAAVHEYLHIAMDSKTELLTRLIDQYGPAYFVDMDAMKNAGYVNLDGAVEDCIVRALSALLDGQMDTMEYGARNAAMGFTAVPKLITRLQGKRIEDMTLEELLLSLM